MQKPCLDHVRKRFLVERDGDGKRQKGQRRKNNDAREFQKYYKVRLKSESRPNPALIFNFAHRFNFVFLPQRFFIEADAN